MGGWERRWVDAEARFRNRYLTAVIAVTYRDAVGLKPFKSSDDQMETNA